MMKLRLLIVMALLIMSSNSMAFNCEIAGTFKSGSSYILVTKDPSADNLYFLELYDKQLGCKQFLESKAYQDGPVFLTSRHDKAVYDISFKENCTKAQIVWQPKGLQKECKNFFTDPNDGMPWIFEKVKE